MMRESSVSIQPLKKPAIMPECHPDRAPRYRWQMNATSSEIRAP